MFLNRLSIGLSVSSLIASPFVYFWSDKLAGAVIAVVGLMIGLASLAKRFRPEPLFKLQVGREGRLLIMITLAIGLAALNTGSNLLYLILGMLLSLIVASGMLSQFVLGRLKVARYVPEGIQAHRSFLTRTDITNRKIWMPSFNLIIRITPSKLGFGSDCFVPCVEAKQTERVYSQFTFSRRGRHDLSAFEGTISTRFPFGIFTKSRRFTPSGTALVFPAPSNRLNEDELNKDGGAAATRSPQQSDEIQGLKVFSQGDDLKRIDWKRSTIGNQWIVRDAPPTRGKTQHVWLFRSLATVPFDPLEEAWISFVFEMAKTAQDLNEHLVLHLGEREIASSDGTGGHELIAQTLALLDTKTLPKQCTVSNLDHLVIDISKPLPHIEAAQ